MSSRRSSRSEESIVVKGPVPESPLSDREPRQREATSKKSAKVRLSPNTPVPLRNSKEAPKHPRRYSAENSVTDFRLEEVHRPTDRVVHVDLEQIENRSVIRAGTPSSALSMPSDHSLLNDSLMSDRGGPRTSTPKKSMRKSRRAPESLYKKVLKKSTSRTAVGRPSDATMDAYETAPEYAMDSSADSFSPPIRIEASEAGYRSANSTQRALFSQQGAAPIARRSSRSASRSRLAPVPSTMCQLVTPLIVQTSHEVNAVSVTGQILVISQTLVRSAHASDDVRKLINHLAGKMPLISNEMSQVDIDHDNEHSKHEVFVGSNAILIQRVSTVHRGRDRNSFETEDRRTYRFICQGDLLPEDRRDKQTKPRYLTIIAESATVKNCEEIEKSERVVLVFDAADQPARVLGPMPTETSLTHATNDLTARPSALRDSPVSFEEQVRVSDHSHINIVRKACVQSSARLWDEPLTELKEQRVYKQQLADDANCEPVRITRSHSMTREPQRNRSPSATRRPSSRVERSRTPGRSSVLRPLQLSDDERHPRSFNRPPPDCTPSAPVATDLRTCISPLRDEPARRENRRRTPVLEIDDTVQHSDSLPARTTDSEGSPDHKTPANKTMRYPPRQKSPARDPAEIIVTVGSFTPARSVRTADTQATPLTSRRSHRSPSPVTARLSEEDRLARSVMRTPSPSYRQQRPSLTPLRTGREYSPCSSQQRPPLTPLRTARQNSPHVTPTRRAVDPVIVDEDTSAGSSQSPTQRRTPTTVSPRPARLATAVYESPSVVRRRPSADATVNEWDRMLDATQPASPMPADASRRLPADFLPSSASAASDSRLARATMPNFRSARLPERRGQSTPRRPLGPAKSCLDLGVGGARAGPLYASTSPSPRFHPLRRAASEMSLPTPRARSASASGAPAPANSAIAIAAPFRRQQYVAGTSPAACVPPVIAPVPRPRTTRPLPCAPSSDPEHAPAASQPVAISASGSATRQSAAAAAPSRHSHLAMPTTVIAKPARPSSNNTQKNVELVHNPEDFDEGEILRKKLTLEAKINGHMWNLTVTFALKAERADLIRFAPKRVRIDDQTLWEETENWSQTSLTPVTGPRTVARGSTSYDQQPLPKPASGNSSTQTMPALQQQQTEVHVAPKTLATASTASSAWRSKRSVEKKDASKRSQDSKKRNGTPFV